MNTVYAMGVAVAAAIIVYAHAEIPRFTRGGVKRMVAHAALVVTGVALGALWAATPGLSQALNGPAWLGFVAGFAVVHVPAAAIFAIKAWRHSGRS